MNYKKGLGFVLVFLGIFVIIIQPFSITGAVIDVSSSVSKIWFGIGIVLVIGGGLLVAWGREEGGLATLVGKEPEIKELPYSLTSALKEGISESEAKELLLELNKKAESGEWIVLKQFTVAPAKSPRYSHGTSSYSYWGPEEYKGLSGKKLEGLYNQGKIGKTHEIVRGSDVYDMKNKRASIPPKGSRVLHRHWEIGQVYRKRREGKP